MHHAKLYVSSTGVRYSEWYCRSTAVIWPTKVSHKNGSCLSQEAENSRRHQWCSFNPLHLGAAIQQEPCLDNACSSKSELLNHGNSSQPSESAFPSVTSASFTVSISKLRCPNPLLRCPQHHLRPLKMHSAHRLHLCRLYGLLTVPSSL